MGYNSISKAYRIWNNDSKKISESRNVAFDEHSMLTAAGGHDPAHPTNDVVMLSIEGSSVTAIPTVIYSTPDALPTLSDLPPSPLIGDDVTSEGNGVQFAYGIENIASIGDDDQTLASWEDITVDFPTPHFPAVKSELSDLQEPVAIFDQVVPVATCLENSTKITSAIDLPPYQGHERKPPSRYGDWTYVASVTIAPQILD
jgi:hypothetical protein